MENLKHIFTRVALNPENILLIYSKFHLKVYAKNEYLLQAGQTATKLFFINKGSVILGNECKDQPITRHLVKEKEFITSLRAFPAKPPLQSS